MLQTLAMATRRSGGRSRKYVPTVVGVLLIPVPAMFLPTRHFNRP